MIAAMVDDKVLWNCRHARTKSAICFLQRDNVCADFADDVKDSCWFADAVSADCLADVVSGDPDHESPIAPRLLAAKPER